jgi:hypothetical protein
MKKLATLVLFSFVLSTGLAGCSKKNTRDDEEVAEQPQERQIEEATSGGMERGFEEEDAPAADEDPMAEEAGSEEAPE